MPTTKRKLKLSGCFSILNGLIAFPIFLVCLSLARIPLGWEKKLMISMDVLSLGLGVYVLITFKQLLNSRFKFNQTNAYILLLVGLNISIFALNTLSLDIGQTAEIMGKISLYGTIVLGVSYILFAIKLLSCPDNLYGLRKVFAYLTICVGVCFASESLIPMGILVGIAADITLGLIFLRAAKAT